ncbi:MAG: hypothetical protein V4670_02150 [Bacteroidota bacterium]
MKKLLIIFLTLTIISCKNQTQDKTSTDSELKDTIKTDLVKNEKKLDSKNKVEIDFIKNRDLLDIILLLPDTAFSSWEWKLEDRIKWYNEIKTNSFYIDKNPDFFNQKYFEQTRAGFSIVDGFWSINIYKTTENTYIVITDDIVGEGNELNFYEVKANRIKEYLNEKLIFSDFKELLKMKNADENCNEKFEELSDPIFEYDFSIKNKIEIESSWYLTEENYSNCLTGNALLYNFNPQNKKFEIEKIYWKQKQNN